MTVSDTVTFWHLQFFSTVTVEFEVTHFVVLPNLQKELYMKVMPGQIKDDESIHHWWCRYWSYLKVNSRREGACSQRRCGESPRAKFESVIGRPQNNSSWTDSEAVY